MVKELSDNILQAERSIATAIQSTKNSIVKSQVETGCSYNHYLRISESKFTENVTLRPFRKSEIKLSTLKKRKWKKKAKPKTKWTSIRKPSIWESKIWKSMTKNNNMI